MEKNNLSVNAASLITCELMGCDNILNKQFLRDWEARVVKGLVKASQQFRSLFHVMKPQLSSEVEDFLILRE